MKRKRIYISGKMSGLTKEEYGRKFSDAKNYLEKLGYEAVDPSVVSCEIIPYKDIMWADLRILMDCDGIYMLDNWKDSKGAKAEYYFADAIGLEIMFEDEAITDCSNCHHMLDTNKTNIQWCHNLVCGVDGKKIDDNKLALHCKHFDKIFSKDDLL